MIIVLSTIFFMIFVFASVASIAYAIYGKQMKIEERVRGVTEEKKTERKIVKEKKVKVKEKKQTFSKTRKELKQIEEELYNVGIKMPVSTFVTVWIVATVALPLLIYIISGSWLVGLIVAVICAFGPMMLIRMRKQKRKKMLESQLVDGIATMCNALRAGHSFQTALKNIATEMEAPISEEFGRVFRETQRGMTIEESLNRMTERTGCEDMEILCTAIAIQRKVGGNLADVLEKISETIQIRIDLRGEIKARTASGRMSGYIVGALPFVLLIMMWVMNPDYASVLFTTSTGNMMLAVSAVLEVVGFIVIKKIVTIKY